MTFLLVIDLVLRIFPFFSHIFRMFTMSNVVYDHFLTRKTQFFTLSTLLLKILGGTNAWAVPSTLNFCGGRPPVPPRSPPLAIILNFLNAPFILNFLRRVRL